VDYDIYVDIDNIAQGLQEVIDKRPDFRDVLTTGWEKCTARGGQSLLEDESAQNHAMKGFGLKDSKLVMYDKLFCDDQLSELVYNRYKDDYNIFKKQKLFKVHSSCLSNVFTNSMTVSAISPNNRSLSRRESGIILLENSDLAPAWLKWEHEAIRPKDLDSFIYQREDLISEIEYLRSEIKRKKLQLLNLLGDY